MSTITNPTTQSSSYTGGYCDYTINDRGERVVDAQTAAWMKQVREKEAGTPNIQFENMYEGKKTLSVTLHGTPNPAC